MASSSQNTLPIVFAVNAILGDGFVPAVVTSAAALPQFVAPNQMPAAGFSDNLQPTAPMYANVLPPAQITSGAPSVPILSSQSHYASAPVYSGQAPISYAPFSSYNLASTPAAPVQPVYANPGYAPNQPGYEPPPAQPCYGYPYPSQGLSFASHMPLTQPLAPLPTATPPVWMTLCKSTDLKDPSRRDKYFRASNRARYMSNPQNLDLLGKIMQNLREIGNGSQENIRDLVRDSMDAIAEKGDFIRVQDGYGYAAARTLEAGADMDIPQDKQLHLRDYLLCSASPYQDPPFQQPFRQERGGDSRQQYSGRRPAASSNSPRRLFSRPSSLDGCRICGDPSHWARVASARRSRRKPRRRQQRFACPVLPLLTVTVFRRVQKV